MRVLVIRPEIQGLSTARKIAELGHDAVVFPLFQPQHDLERASEALAQPHSALAITSAEAVRCLQGLGDALEAYRDTLVFAVGKATAQHAREAGFRNIVAGPGNGNDLAAMILGYYAALGAPKAPVLYLAGQKRSPDFENILTEHAIPHVASEVYGMEPVVYGVEQQQKLLVNNPVNAVFLFSKENARAFFGLEVFRNSKESLRKTLFFCLSRKIAEAVPEEFANSTVVSTAPDENELIDLL